MSMPEHNPLPWHDDDAFIKDANGRIVDMRTGNRRIIIASVNSRAALLAAAKNVITAFGDDDDDTLSGDENAALRALRAAIAAEEPSTWID